MGCNRTVTCLGVKCQMMFFALYGNNGLSLQIFTARKRSLGQGNVFTPVCHSVHRGGWWLPSMHWEGEFPSMHWEGGVGFPTYTGLASQHALGSGGWLPSMHWNWEKRAVCILLECFLVENEFLDYHLCYLSHNNLGKRLILARYSPLKQN